MAVARGFRWVKRADVNPHSYREKCAIRRWRLPKMWSKHAQSDEKLLKSTFPILATRGWFRLSQELLMENIRESALV